MHVYLRRGTAGATALLALLNGFPRQQCYASPPETHATIKPFLEFPPPKSMHSVAEITKWAETIFFEEWRLYTISPGEFGRGETPLFVVIVGQNYSGDLDPDVFLYAKVKEMKDSPWRLAFAKRHAYSDHNVNNQVSGALFDGPRHRVRLITSAGGHIYSIDTREIEKKMK